MAKEVARLVAPLVPSLPHDGPTVHALEPSAGIGRFLRAFEPVPGITWHAVEWSELSARMLHVLRPDVDLMLAPFERWVREKGAAGSLSDVSAYIEGATVSTDGVPDQSYLGTSLSLAPDLDGDGGADLLLGADETSIYLVSGSEVVGDGGTVLGSDVAVRDFGATDGHSPLVSAAAGSDLDGDGIPDLWFAEGSTQKARDARKLKRRDGPEPSFRAQNALSWADLLQRVFRVNGWECPHCHKAMSLRTVVIGVPECTRILHGLQNSTGPPAEA